MALGLGVPSLGRAGAGTYTNATPMPSQVGGIPAGTTFDHVPQDEMWTMLLYAYQFPAFTSFGFSGVASILEVGDSVPQNVTATWGTTNAANVVANSIKISDISLGYDIATGLANDGSEAISQTGAVTKITATTHLYRIYGTNTQSGTFSRDLSFAWRWRQYWGNSANTTLTEAQIEALANSPLASSIAGTYAMAAGGYKYICMADSVAGQINLVKDGLGWVVPMATSADDPAYANIDGGGYSYALVSVTNAFGVTTNYRVYRTKNSMGGAITLIVT